jgi:hydroxymethylpyrimidine pyrophosphatase-like HAD family hydrolase
MNKVSNAVPIDVMKGGPCVERSLRAVGIDPLATAFLDTETRFYGGYPWCLDICPQVRHAVEHLRDELARANEPKEPWQAAEVRINVYLMACAITDAVDDYLLGRRYDFSRVAAVLPLAGVGVRAVEAWSKASRTYRAARLRPLRSWRASWKTAVDRFLKAFVAGERTERFELAAAGAPLVALLGFELPDDLRNRRIRIPAAFRTQDLTHLDILALARSLAGECPDREQPIVAVGLRTAGSYFAPLVHAFLADRGYRHSDWVTIRPKRDLASWERSTLAEVATRGGVAVVIDEAPNSGSTLANAVSLMRTAGFAPDNIVLVVPIHPTRRDWAGGHGAASLTGIRVVTLAPEQWHKQRHLLSREIDKQLLEYFDHRGYSSATVVAGASAAAFNQHLQRLSDEKFHTRLKRVYEVQLRDEAGRPETRYVMAKSVGWGWLGYHAFVAAERLAGFVPPVLGLRHGILYSEWLPSNDIARADRSRLVEVLGSYVAARVGRLRLDCDPTADLSRADQHKGSAVLSAALSKAYGWKATSLLRRARIRRELEQVSCPYPVLIDGKMRQQEWIGRGREWRKTDFEHHGLGKTELNVTDPAYDLADATLHFNLSSAEEAGLIRRYVEQSGDRDVESRLVLYKLLAGTWAMSAAVDDLGDARLAHRHDECNERYLEARNFLTVHMMRHCASLCRRPRAVEWRSPLVVLDIDGVLDKQIFGFPSTTTAGIEAVSLLHAHGLAIAVNTARTLSEVKDYCQAYGLVGGVAEYGGAVWDAVARRERSLVSEESLAQLDQIKAALRKIPGAFVDEGYRFSIRAYTFERGVTVPLPTILVRNLMASLKTDRLAFHQTFVDTTVLATETDKGRGLIELLATAGHAAADTIAVGDSEADLPMFRVAGRSFAPSHISCRSVARLVGCRIMDRSYQAGFLRAACAIVHPDGETCEACRVADPSKTTSHGLMRQLLDAADQPRWRSLLGAVLDPMAVEVFAK